MNVCDECHQSQDDPQYSYHEAWCSKVAKRPEVPVTALIPGKSYRVAFDDCCAQGYFTAVFERYGLDEDGEPYEAGFVGAYLYQLWAQYTVTELTV